ncbi:FAD-dependent monooxygenase [Afipia sp. GAS231]|uniref:FAD-dependent monooxygenase n=1 Tax=Afipia sp. GAS231 TaxID=1882747 RepID=UPI00087A3CAA|nr:FAD-dependent monooxygenase [Afipia sp. GAS231]SDO51056.1 2-polyprenyl-6-methoxyphenol hydroxylase [Afipia sp. GAS231]
MNEKILIVGAGPVGLWLAAELQLAGVKVRIVERAAERRLNSRAFTVQPRTLEVLAMRGREQPFLDDGLPILSSHFGALTSRLDFRSLDTRFPFVLMHPQSETERKLENIALELGTRIDRNHTVTAVSQDPDGVDVDVVGPRGAEKIRSEYVVGCDGASSFVRRAIGVEFRGTDSSVYGFLGDVTVDDPPPPGFNVNSTGGMLMIIPKPGDSVRIVGIDATQQQGNSKLEYSEFRESVIRLAGTDFGMRDPVWLSRYGDASRQVASYRSGRVLLAGDAAHVHFPAGGVGLNVGVQDAMNLGWKLAAQVQGRAPEGLLDSYHAERWPVGDALLQSTKAQVALIYATTPSAQALRGLFNELVALNSQVSLELARRSSALDVAYPPASKDSHAITGKRAPDLQLTGIDGQSTSLYRLLHGGQPLLMHLRGSEAPRSGLDVIDSVRVWSGRVVETGQPDWAGLRAVLVRPDGHVAWAAEQPAETNAGILSGVIRVSERNSLRCDLPLSHDPPRD